MRKTLILAVLLAIASDAHAAKRAKKPPPAPPPIPVLRLVNADGDVFHIGLNTGMGCEADQYSVDAYELTS